MSSNRAIGSTCIAALRGLLVSSVNTQLLVSALESQAEVDGRYINLKCVNIDSLTGAQRGCFSLVFKAFDKVDQRAVALKFFDLDAGNIFAQYRFDAFRREHTILQSLLGVRRCLQVASSFSTYTLRCRDQEAQSRACQSHLPTINCGTPCSDQTPR